MNCFAWRSVTVRQLLSGAIAVMNIPAVMASKFKDLPLSVGSSAFLPLQFFNLPIGNVGKNNVSFSLLSLFKSNS